MSTRLVLRRGTIEHRAASLQALVDHVLPCLLRVVPLGTIVVVEQELAGHGLTTIIGLTTCRLAIGQIRTGANGIHQHSHCMILLAGATAAQFHQVVFYGCALRQRLRHRISIRISRSVVLQFGGIILAIVVDDLRSGRCHTTRHSTFALLVDRTQVVIGRALVPMGLTEDGHILPFLLETLHATTCRLQPLADTTLRSNALRSSLNLTNAHCPVLEHGLQLFGQFVKYEIALIGIAEDGRCRVVTTHNNKTLTRSAREYIIRCNGHIVTCRIIDANEFLCHQTSLSLVDRVSRDNEYKAHEEQ